MHLASYWKRHLQIKKCILYSLYKNKALSPKPCTCKYSMGLHEKCCFIDCPSRTHMHLIHAKGIQLKPLHKNTNVETSASMLQLQAMLQCFPSCFYPNLEWNFTRTWKSVAVAEVALHSLGRWVRETGIEGAKRTSFQLTTLITYRWVVALF